MASLNLNRCRRFSQNAWKKDLCSNCFKSKEEHQRNESPLAIFSDGQKKQQPKQSILKAGNGSKEAVRGEQRTGSGGKVKFLAEESEVIGYGGDDEFDISDDEINESNTTEENLDGYSDQEDIDLQRLTKSNTDFNSITSNLMDSNETDAKKNNCRIPLRLGCPDLDEGGRKCTLLVSVKPFGSSSKPEPTKINKSVYHDNDTDLEKNYLIQSKDDGIVKQETDNFDRSNNKNETAVVSNCHLADICLDEKTNECQDANVSQQNTVEKGPAVLINSSSDLIKEPESLDISQKRILDNTDERSTSGENKRGATLLSRGIMLTKTHQQVITKRFQSPTRIEDDHLKTLLDVTVNDNSIFSKRTDKNVVDYDYSSNQLNVNGLGPRQKNYKNVLASDEDKIKCLSFKHYKSGLDFDCYQGEDVPLTSRESAGEPDGRADPDIKDEPPLIPPALPSSPPPSGPRSPPNTPPPPPPPPPVVSEDHPPPRTSFLHSMRSIKVQHKQSPFVNDVPVNQLSLSAEIDSEERLAVAGTGPSQEEPLSRYCCNGIGTGGKFIDSPSQLLQHQQQTIMKRQAPKPPLSPVITSIDVINDKSKSTISDQLSLSINCNISNGISSTRSASHDSLSCNSPFVHFSQLSPSSSGPATKRGSKVRSTLRKLLRFGSRSDEDFLDECHTNSVIGVGATSVNSISNGSAARSRPEIIHPLDLNKSGVQVLCNTTNSEKIYGVVKMDDPVATQSISAGGGLLKTIPIVSQQHCSHSFTGRPSKPPPPPRSQSLEMSGRGPVPPARPPPPLSVASTSIIQSETGRYVNLGDETEVKPNKPNRSASRKDSVESTAHTNVQNENESSLYENVRLRASSATVIGDSLVATPSSHALNSHVSYCGSETESDIGYYGGIITNNEVPGGLFCDDRIESDGWRSASGNGKRKQRSVLHRSLEENYSAVIIANHEALSQLLEQANRNSPFSRSLNIFKSGDSRLCWTDFAVDESIKSVVIGCRTFFAAQYKGNAHLPSLLTLCVSFASSAEAAGQIGDKLPNSLQVITEFNDFISSDFINCNYNMKKAVMSSNSSETNDMVEVTVSVLVRQVIEPFFLHNWPSLSADSMGAVEKLNLIKETGLVLYQLINCLLSLHDRAINFIHKSDIILCKISCKENDNSLDDTSFRLCLLCPQHLSSTLMNVSGAGKNGLSSNYDATIGDRVSSHQCLIDSLHSMPLPSHLSAPLNKLAAKHRNSTSLSQAKALLELWLWGPPCDVVTTPLAERHHVIQRWLDLEKANLLQSLLMACPLPLQLNTYAHCHLSFLVQTNAKVIDDALTFFTDFHSTGLNSNTEC